MTATVQDRAKPDPSMLYDTSFFERQRDRSITSADLVVPLFLERFDVGSIADIGCGVGGWLAAFRRNGVDKIAGFDGDYVDRRTLVIPPENFTAVDLTNPPEFGQFDAVCTLEVAEHLPESSADQFVARLTEAARVVLFSAAIPGQGGRNHINLKWPSYWAKKFATHGYVPLDFIRPQIWGDTRIAAHYRQNILVFCRPEMVPGGLVPVKDFLALDLIIPSDDRSDPRTKLTLPRSIREAIFMIRASLGVIALRIGRKIRRR